MKITESRTYTTDIIKDVLCDVCGNSCCKFVDNKLIATESATISADWGYYSDSDGKEYNIEICENCFYDVVAHLKAQNKTDGRALNGLASD